MKIWRLVCGVAIAGVGCGSGSSAPAPLDASHLVAAMVDAHPNEAGTVDADATSDGPGMDLAMAPSTWSSIYSQLLVNNSYPSNCTGSACHDPGVQKGIDLSNPQKGYTTILNRVTPGMPSASDLVTVLQSGYMPTGRPHMPASDIAQISAWIQAGAQND